jgi:COP9 signalosome complex subunit 7
MNTLGGGAALKPYIARINESTSDSAVAELIPSILGDPTVYVFGEILALPKVQSLANGEHKKTHELLQIFAYGQYSDYLAQQAHLEKLNDRQATKLRHLTIVSLAAESRVIPYHKLVVALGLSSAREAEEVVIDALYTGIITGKLDSGTKQFTVEAGIGRDVRPQDLDALLAVLTQWEKESKGLVVAIEGKMKYASEEHEKVSKMKENHAKQVEDTRASVKLIMESEMEGGGMMQMMSALMGAGFIPGMMMPGMHGMHGMHGGMDPHGFHDDRKRQGGGGGSKKGGGGNKRHGM